MTHDTTKVFIPVREQMILDWSAYGLRRLERYLGQCAAFEEYCRQSGREWSAPHPSPCPPHAPCH
jgi:hypothetical protein